MLTGPGVIFIKDSHVMNNECSKEKMPKLRTYSNIHKFQLWEMYPVSISHHALTYRIIAIKVNT